jgi:hypothetical protein
MYQLTWFEPETGELFAITTPNGEAARQAILGIRLLMRNGRLWYKGRMVIV